MSHPLRIATYNLHKGLSFFNRRLVIHEIREHLRTLDSDLVFLQEVQGQHQRRARHHGNWPAQPQYEFLADTVWPQYAYGKNAIYDAGHHGNAILSRYPIARWDNQDVSSDKLDRRGLLHCEITPPAWGGTTLHCICVHFGLLWRYRQPQLRALRLRIERLVPHDAPLIVAGDFNDWWRRRTHDELAAPLGMQEVFECLHGQPARSFPAALPLMALDRIYVRGFEVRHTEVHHGRRWLRSDHAALTAVLAKP